MARQSLDRARVVRAAAELADDDGLEAVTLARVAAVLGVRSPSLYNHVEGLDGLVRGIALLGLGDLAGVLREAAIGRAGPEALTAAAHAWRAYAQAHPGCYAATLRAPDPGDAELTAAAAAIVDVL